HRLVLLELFQLPADFLQFEKGRVQRGKVVPGWLQFGRSCPKSQLKLAHVRTQPIKRRRGIDWQHALLISIDAQRWQIYSAAARRECLSPFCMLDFCIYIVYRAGSALLAALPWRVLFALGNGAGFCGWMFLRKYRRLALHNVSIAFGNEKSPRELRRLVRRHFQRLGSNFFYSAKIISIPVEKLLRRVTTENLDSLDRELRAGVPVVLVLSHLANWELFAQLMPQFVSHARA